MDSPSDRLSSRSDGPDVIEVQDPPGDKKKSDNGSTDSENSKSKKSDDDNKGDDGGEPEKKPMSPHKKFVLLAILAAVVIVGLLVAVPWYLHARLFEGTDDAFIDAHWEKTAPQVAGRVLKVLVDDNQVVQAGTPLVEIDPADYNVALENANAGYAQAEAQLAQAQSQKLVAEANVGQQQAEVDRQQVNRDNAATELARYEGLSAEAVSRQQLDNQRVALRTQDAQLESAKKMLDAQKAQITLADSQIKAGEAGVVAAQAKIDQAKLNLGYTHVTALTSGRVTRRSVQEGDYVTAGQQLMFVVPNDVYVTANYKEDQLTDMRPGQEVDIEVDAYPDVAFKGKVESIQAGSGPAFSLLPPENATGNYVKVVQRVPVKIIFEDTGSDTYKRLGPGMSVQPKVRVR